jgi:hypothetical protein
MGCSPGHGREGKRCGEVWGWCSPFIGVGEHRGGVVGGVTVALMSSMPLKTVRLRGVKEGVLMAG